MRILQLRLLRKSSLCWIDSKFVLRQDLKGNYSKNLEYERFVDMVMASVYIILSYIRNECKLHEL